MALESKVLLGFIFIHNQEMVKRNLDRVRIGLIKVGQKTTFRIVAAMSFVQNEDTLDIDVEALGQDIRVILKL